MTRPILDDPIFTEDDESEDETLKNQLESIVNREVSFIPNRTNNLTPELPILEHISSSQSSTSSTSSSDSDSSDKPLAVVAAKMSKKRRRKSSGDSVIMAKKVIDFMKFEQPNGTVLSMTINIFNKC